jgi:cell wall-associated NlpC family hydrolase
MTFHRDRFIQVTNYLKNAALILLVAFITVKCEVLNELTREPLPKTTTTGKRPTAGRPPGKAPSSKELALRKDIVAYAQKYKGAKYASGGKSPSTGFDCSGFTSYVLKYFDISVSPGSQSQAKQGVPRSLDNVLPGDLIFFRRPEEERIFHVAMVVSNDGKSLKVIHSTSRGVVMDDILNSKYWEPKIESARDVVSSFL